MRGILCITVATVPGIVLGAMLGGQPRGAGTRERTSTAAREYEIRKSEIPHSSAVIALVDGTPITFGQVWRRVGQDLEFARAGQPEDRFREYAKRMLERSREDMISRRLMLARAKEEKIQITERDIERAAQRDMERFNMGGENLTTIEDYWEAVREIYGFEEREWREELRARVIISQLYRTHVWVPQYFSPELVRSYYQAHREDFQEGGVVRVRHVYIRRALPEFETVVKELLAAVDRKEDFKGLAAKAVAQGHSSRRGRDEAGLYVYRIGESQEDDPGNDGADADLDVLRDPFPQIIRGLEVGEISRALHTPVGTHFFKLESRGGGRVRSFAEVQGMIQDLLARQLEKEAEKRYLEDLKRKADIVRLPFPEKTPLGTL